MATSKYLPSERCLKGKTLFTIIIVLLGLVLAWALCLVPIFYLQSCSTAYRKYVLLISSYQIKISVRRSCSIFKCRQRRRCLTARSWDYSRTGDCGNEKGTCRTLKYSDLTYLNPEWLVGVFYENSKLWMGRSGGV